MTKEEKNGDIGPVLDTSSQLKREATRRTYDYSFRAIGKDQISEYTSDGWGIDKKLKKRIRVKKIKPIDEQLEDKLWILLYRLGYHEMNQGRSFKIRYQRRGASPLNKQIDVFAKDDETIVIAECKANSRFSKRSLQKDIEEFAALRKDISTTVNRYYGGDFRPKYVWLFVTENIIWSKPDKERAKSLHIGVITEREYRYYRQIAELLGPAARFQFLAEFLKDQSIHQLENRAVPAIRGRLGGKKFFCFATNPEELLKISFVNHRSLQDPDGYPTYQRMISKSRLKKIGKYITDGGFFPTNFLINFTREPRFDRITGDDHTGVVFGNLYLPSKYRSAWIVDGQHRLYGYAKLDPKMRSQNIVVIAFFGLTKTEEANLFVTINHEQKSVPRRLLDDLEGDLKWESDNPSERISSVASRIIAGLNQDYTGPFFGKVAQHDIRITRQACLTIPALMEAIRKSGIIGRSILQGRSFQPGPLTGGNNAETYDRAINVITGYFTIIRESNRNQWDMGSDGILCMNRGIQGHIHLLSGLLDYLEKNTHQDPKHLSPAEVIEQISPLLKPVLDYYRTNSDDHLKREFDVRLGSSGQKDYFMRLSKIVHDVNNDFTPHGLSEWTEETSEENIKKANQQVIDLITKIQFHVFEILKNQYGNDEAQYWKKGVPNINTRTEAYRRQQEDPKGGPIEQYLELMELKSIIERSEHWDWFKPIFDIPEPGEKGKARNLGWMARLNELRRIQAHPAKTRRYSQEDFDFLDRISSEFAKRLIVKRQHINDEQ